jgi:hypothetical protein
VIQLADDVADQVQAAALAVIDRLDVPPELRALTALGDTP